MDAANISVANKSITSSDLDISKLPMIPRFSGIAGTKNFLVRNTAIIDGIPKTIVVLRLTNPCLYFGNTPRSEEHTSELQSRGHLVYRLLLVKQMLRIREKHEI